MAEVRFKQLVAANWVSNDGRMSYTLFGLTEDGVVYRQTGRTTANGEWIRENMDGQESTPRSYPQTNKPYWNKRKTKEPPSGSQTTTDSNANG